MASKRQQKRYKRLLKRTGLPETSPTPFLFQLGPAREIQEISLAAIDDASLAELAGRGNPLGITTEKLGTFHGMEWKVGPSPFGVAMNGFKDGRQIYRVFTTRGVEDLATEFPEAVRAFKDHLKKHGRRLAVVEEDGSLRPGTTHTK
jgi:hypothetical protein